MLGHRFPGALGGNNYSFCVAGYGDADSLYGFHSFAVNVNAEAFVDSGVEVRSVG